MIVKVSYLSLFLLKEKMQKFFLKSQLSHNSQTSKTTICKNVLQNRTKYLNCSQSKKRHLQGLNQWPSNLQLCTLTSQPRRQLNRSCFFHSHYLQLAPSTLWFRQSKGQTCFRFQPASLQSAIRFLSHLATEAVGQYQSKKIHIPEIWTHNHPTCSPIAWPQSHGGNLSTNLLFINCTGQQCLSFQHQPVPNLAENIFFQEKL